MRIKVSLLLVIFSFCIIFGPALSGEEGKKEDEKVSPAKKENAVTEEPRLVETIVVVAKRVPEDIFKTDRSVSLLSGDSISETSPRTVPEALFDAPGAFVQQTNHGGGSPIIRGMVGPQILISVDGVRFNNSLYRTGPVQYLNLIDPLSLEQIEVLRGPGSVAYGSDAMGGVIRLNTTPNTFSGGEGVSVSGNLLTRYQSANGGGIYHGGFAADYQGWSFLGGFSKKHFNNLTGGEGVGSQLYSGYNSVSTMGKLARRFSRGVFRDWELTIGYLFTSIEDAGRTDKLFDQNALQLYDNRDHLMYTRLNAIVPAISTTGSLTISWQDFYERKDNHKVKNDYATILKTTRDKTRAQTIGVDVNMSTSIQPEKWRINYGGMYYRDSVSAERYTGLPGASFVRDKGQDYPDGSTFANYGMYAMLEWDALKTAHGGLFRFNGGWRHHGVSSHVPERGTLPEVQFAFSGNVFSFSGQYLVGEVFNLSLTYSQGFRAPNLSEAVMLGDTGQFFHIPNYNLRPENSNTLELSAKGRMGSLTLSAAGYVSFLDDFIKRDSALWDGKNKIDGKGVVININAGEGLMWGIEGGFLWGLTGGLSLSGNMTYTWGEERVSGGNNIPLTRIPPLFGQLKARYDFLKGSRFQGFAESYVRGATRQARLSAEDLKDSRIPKGGTPGWWTLNFRVGGILWDHLRCNLDIENIFNKAYKYHGSGIYNPGTGVALTLEIY